AGLERETLAGLGQAEDEELRRKRDEKEPQPAAGGQTGTAGQRSQGDGPERGKRKKRERDVPRRENERRVAVAAERGQLRDQVDCDAAQDREAGETEKGPHPRRRAHRAVNLQLISKFLAGFASRFD